MSSAENFEGLSWNDVSGLFRRYDAIPVTFIDEERQLHREGMELNDLEVATQKLWQDWMEADEIKSKQQQAKAAAQRQLPPERRAAQLEREKQARVTGLGTSPSAEDRYPGWVAKPRKKPTDGHDPPTSYQTPSDMKKKDQTIDERNATLGDELGAKDVLDPLGLSSPGPQPSPGPQTPPQFEDADIDIPSISLPGTSPITSADNQLLGVGAESPMETTSASHLSLHIHSQHPVIFKGTWIGCRLCKGHTDVFDIIPRSRSPATRTRARYSPLSVQQQPVAPDCLRGRSASKSRGRPP